MLVAFNWPLLLLEGSDCFLQVTCFSMKQFLSLLSSFHFSMKNLAVLDSTPGVMYPKIVSIVNQEVFSLEVCKNILSQNILSHGINLSFLL